MAYRRNVKKNEFYDNARDDDDDKKKKGFIQRIKNLDANPKIHTNKTQKSGGGAFLSLFVIFVTLFIIWTESTIYFEPISEDFMYLDTERTEKMRIAFDISFYSMQCNDLSVDVVDVNGDQQIDIHHSIVKTPTNEDGESLGHYEIQKGLGSDSTNKIHLPHDYCGSCYGALAPNQCCNTCAEVKKAFQLYGRSESMAESTTQCTREKKYKNPGENGCRVKGTLMVPKMSGNFHIAAGTSHSSAHMDHQHHIHHINLTTINDYDISHHINHLRFGKLYPGMENTLDNTDYIAPGLGNLGYYFQLVPTLYESKIRNEKPINTFQYSVYEHYTSVDTTQGHYKLPGVFFKYEFYPMRIKYSEETKPFLPFLVRVFAIIGGMYAMVGFIYRLLDLIYSLITGKKTVSDIKKDVLFGF